MPHPSTACGTCKLRRVKCDETKPVCNRCQKAKRVCLAPTSGRQAQFAIHLENRYASGQKKRPRGPRATLNLPHPDPDLESKALAYYLEHHVKVPPENPDVLGGLHACIIAWRKSGIHCAMVDLGLSTMALAVYSQTQNHPTAAEEAVSRYYRLLGMAQTQIAEVESRIMDKNSIDSCLLAIYLMGRYEGAIYSPGDAESFHKLHSWNHHDGAMGILKVWSDTLSHTAPSIIVRETRRGLMRSCVLRDLDLPEWMENGKRFGEAGLELEYDNLNVRLIKLRHATLQLGPPKPVNHQELAYSEGLYEGARALDDALQAWSSHLTHPPREHLIPDADVLRLKHFWSLKLYGYESPGCAAIWALYFSQRLLISSVRLILLAHTRYGPLKDFADERERRMKEQSQALADSIASSLPFCLDQVRVENDSVLVDSKTVQPLHASCVVWPLTIAGSARGINEEQRSWFRAELAGAGRVLGAGVIAEAEEEKWPTL